MTRILMMSILTAIGHCALAAVVEPRVERFDADRVTVSWNAAAPVDVFIANRADAAMKEATLVAKANRDGRQLVTASDDRRTFFLLRDSADGQMIVVSERLLPLERGSNYRDLGGYETADGRRVRWGWIYRSGATPLLTEHDLGYVRSLGLKSMIDLRASEERELAPTRLSGGDMRYIAMDYSFRALTPPRAKSASNTGMYFPWLSTLAPQFRALFGELLAHKAPVAYNCTAGQDRTGIATALVLSALGVPRETILQDYHLSTGFRRPENEMPEFDPAQYPNNPLAQYSAKVRVTRPTPLYTEDGRSLLAALFDDVDARWGSVERYLDQELGIDSEEIAALRASYLE
jgi:protein-tyrosine phosphatase